MKIIKLFMVLIKSLLLWIILLPIRILAFLFNFIEKFFKILKNVSLNLVEEISDEVLK